MQQVSEYMTRTRKAGAEDVILMRIDAGRFFKHLPPHHAPPVDKRSRCQVALVAQSCQCNSFDSHETGPADEVHLWLRMASTDTGEKASGKTIVLPSQHWLSLASASDNPVAGKYLKLFGFSPLILDKVCLREKGGSIIVRDQGQIDWNIISRGRGLERVVVEHVLNVKADGQDSAGHRIYASVSDPLMDQPGRVHIQTDAFEPFLCRGERFAAVVHRMSGLDAHILWRMKANSTTFEFNERSWLSV